MIPVRHFKLTYMTVILNGFPSLLEKVIEALFVGTVQDLRLPLLELDGLATE